MSTDIVISFDTTGSMSSIIQQVRRQVQTVVDELFSRVPDLRVGIVAHGDYADQGETYLARNTQLTDDRSALVNFVKRVPNTCGYSYEEAYEHVLWLARAMNWRADADKYLIMIGDAEPWAKDMHGKTERGHAINPRQLDWHNEAKMLSEVMGVKVISFHALAHYRSGAVPFWRGIAEITGGTYATLDDFPDVVNMIHAVSVHDDRDLLVQYAQSLVDANQMTGGVSRAISELTNGVIVPPVTKITASAYSGSRKSTASSSAGPVDLSAAGDLEPVAPGRFQVLDVEGDVAIKQMVVEHVGESAFKKGSGFYQFGKKAVKVQDYKEVVLFDKTSGMMWSGKAARKMLGLPESGTANLAPTKVGKDMLDRYDVFVQSTSVNRKLLAGTKFLYEVSFE